MGIAKVTRNYQVTVPKDVRRIQDINVGDTVLFAIEDGRVDFFKMNRKEMLKDIAGAWKNKMKQTGVEYVREIRKGWGRRAKRLKI